MRRLSRLFQGPWKEAFSRGCTLGAGFGGSHGRGQPGPWSLTMAVKAIVWNWNRWSQVNDCVSPGVWWGGRVREELDVNLLGFVRVGASSRRRCRNASRFDIGWGGGRLEADKRQLRIANAIGKRLGYFRRGSTAHAADVQVHRLLHRAGSICQGLAELGACLSGRFGVELHESS